MLQELQDFIIEEGDSLEKLNVFLNQPNYFEILGVSHRELQHSNFLQWLLNPKSSHNIGSYFLKNFINILELSPEQMLKINLSNLENTKIYREFHDIDLLILNEELKFTICIENKIKSPKSGKKQLIKYYETVENLWGEEDHCNYYVYLTPYPRVLTKKELDIDYVNITYLQILEILEGTMNNISISMKYLPLISSYIENLKKNIMKTSKEALFAQEIYKKHRKVIDFIVKNKPNLYSKKLYAEINEYFESSDKYENLTPQHKSIIRILPKSVKSIFDFDSHSWKETTSMFALEIFIAQEKIWMKFCFGHIWIKDKEKFNKLQNIKNSMFGEMKQFKSISKGILSRSRSTSKYPSVANFPILKIDDKIVNEAENYFEAFKTGFEKFETETLNRWIKELEENTLFSKYPSPLT